MSMAEFESLSTPEEKLEYAQYRWVEALRVGTEYDAMYWRGVVDGLRVMIIRNASMELAKKMNESKQKEVSP